MQIRQDSTSVTVTDLDVKALGIKSDTDDSFDGFRFDQPTQGDQPIGPEPSNGPEAQESDGKVGFGKTQ